MIRAKVMRSSNPYGADENFEFIGLWQDEHGDTQVALRDLVTKGLYNVVIVHPSKVILEEE